MIWLRIFWYISIIQVSECSFFCPFFPHYNRIMRNPNPHVYLRVQLVQALMSWPVGLILAVRLKKWQHLLHVSPNE